MRPRPVRGRLLFPFSSGNGNDVLHLTVRLTVYRAVRRAVLRPVSRFLSWSPSRVYLFSFTVPLSFRHAVPSCRRAPLRCSFRIPSCSVRRLVSRLVVRAAARGVRFSVREAGSGAGRAPFSVAHRVCVPFIFPGLPLLFLYSLYSL